MLVMVNTNMTHVFKHPKFYRIPRDKKDQAISNSVDPASGVDSVRPGPGHKPQAPSSKPQAKPEPSSGSQDARRKPQAPSNRVQASSHKHQAS